MNNILQAIQNAVLSAPADSALTSQFLELRAIEISAPSAYATPKPPFQTVN